MTEVWYTCQQPVLFPPLFVMERRMRVDHWVVFNEAQFDRWSVQFKLADKNGDVLCSLPCKKPRMKPFTVVEVVEPKRWAGEMQRRVKYIYGREEAFQKLETRWEEFLSYAEKTEQLTRLCDLALRFCIDAMGSHLYSHLMIHDSRGLVDPRPANATQWIEECGRALGATDYVQGAKSLMDYFDPRYMTSMRVWGQEFNATYTGVGKQVRNPSYSVLDTVFTQTSDELRTLLDADNPDRTVHAERYVSYPREGYRRMVE